jgi:hypothetical protein
MMCEIDAGVFRATTVPAAVDVIYLFGNNTNKSNLYGCKN